MSSPVHLIHGGSDETNGDYSLIIRLAANGKSCWWACPKKTQEGDRLLLYVQQPHSEIIAAAQALSDAVEGTSWRYEAKIGRLQLLGKPIALAELRKRFPRWGWPMYPRSYTYLDERLAAWLWKRAAEPGVSADSAINEAITKGAGFGRPEQNALVEKAAVEYVCRCLIQEGHHVKSRERERIGYDLDASKGGKTIHVEVKGISGLLLQFPITAAEVRRAETDSAFHLFAVTEARSRRRQLHRFTGKEFIKGFVRTPLNFIAQHKRPAVPK